MEASLANQAVFPIKPFNLLVSSPNNFYSVPSQLSQLQRIDEADDGISSATNEDSVNAPEFLQHCHQATPFKLHFFIKIISHN